MRANQTPASSRGLPMPNFIGSSNILAARWMEEHNRSYTPLQAYSETYGAGIVSAQSPDKDQDLQTFTGIVSITESLGPSPSTPTPAPPTQTPTTQPPESPTETPSETLTPTPTEGPGPSVTITETPTPSTTESPSPVSSPTPIDHGGGGWPWGWFVLIALVPISTVGGGQVLRYQVWKKRISVEASVDEPNLEWIGPLNPSFDPVSIRVQVFPGSVRFEGPIEVRKREVKDDQ
jgi:hypothetical protein